MLIDIVRLGNLFKNGIIMLRVTRHVLACLYTSFISDQRSRRRHLTDKFNNGVGHLNTVFGLRGREFERSHLQKLKCRALPGGGGGMLKFRVGRRISFK